MSIETIILSILVAIGAVIALVPRMVRSRMNQSEERFNSQLEGEKDERELRKQERLASIEAYKAITEGNKVMLAHISSFGKSVDRLADSDEAKEKQNIAMSSTVGDNTRALAANTASMTGMDNNFQVSITKLITEGSIPTQRIEEIVLAIKALLEIFDPIIRSIPDNMVVMKGLRDVYAASERLVTQAAKTPVAPEDKKEADELVDKIVSNVSNPPVTALAVDPAA